MCSLRRIEVTCEPGRMNLPEGFPTPPPATQGNASRKKINHTVQTTVNPAAATADVSSYWLYKTLQLQIRTPITLSATKGEQRVRCYNVVVVSQEQLRCKADKTNLPLATSRGHRVSRSDYYHEVVQLRAARRKCKTAKRRMDWISHADKIHLHAESSDENSASTTECCAWNVNDNFDLAVAVVQS